MDDLLVVRDSTHKYCQQCGWIPIGEAHHEECAIGSDSKLNEALVCLQFARDMLEGNDCLGGVARETIDLVLGEYPALRDRIAVLHLDDDQ